MEAKRKPDANCHFLCAAERDFHGFHTCLKAILPINTFIHASRHLRHLRHCAIYANNIKNAIFAYFTPIGAMAQVAQVTQSMFKCVNT